MTTNEIALQGDATPAVNSGLGTLVPRNMTEAMETAKMLHASGWFKDLKDAGQALTKIVLGAEMGVSPITAVRGIYVLDTQRGPVITLSGDLEAKLMKAAGYDWCIDQLDESACRLTIFKGPRELGQVSFTIEQARKAGLTARKGDMYQHYAPDMLFNRAIVRARRRFAPEVTGGLPMPVLAAEEVESTYPDPRDDLMRALFMAYRAQFPRDPDQDMIVYRHKRLSWSSDILGREIETWNGPDAPETLTRADVQTLLDALEDAQRALTRGQAAPISPAVPSGVGADPLQHPQSSAARSDTPENEAAMGRGVSSPPPAAEHPSDPGGKAGLGEVTSSPSGASAPTRSRSTTPKQDEFRAAQKVAAVQKENHPMHWLLALSQPHRGQLIDLFGGVNAGQASANHIATCAAKWGLESVDALKAALKEDASLADLLLAEAKGQRQ